MPIYYENIKMPDNHERFLQHALTKTHYDDHQIGDFIKTLKFDQAETLLSQHNFELLIKALPSLQAIQFNTRCFDQEIDYLVCLDRIAARTKLQVVSIDSYLAEYVDIERVSQLYYSINDQLKHQITTLALVDVSIKLQKEGCQELLDYIKRFENVKHLTLYNMDTPTGYQENLDFTTVLDACCDGITSLSYDSYYISYVASDHKYHYNLNSLTLMIPELSEDHLDYLVKYAPNLKELELVANLVGDLIEVIHVSLQNDKSFGLTRYIKQLHRFDFSSTEFGKQPKKSRYWQVIQRIYNGQNFSNLRISFSEHIYLNERIYFDKQTFNVDCKLLLEQFDDMDRPFHFLKLNSISVDYDSGLFGPVFFDEETPTMSDLLEFSVSQQHVQANLNLDYQQIVFCTKPIISSYRIPFQFPKDRSPVQYAYFKGVHLDNQILDKIASFYPTIKNLELVNCKGPKQGDDTSVCIIDLRKFRALQDLVFDIFTRHEESHSFHFQWTNDNQEKYYIYDPSISDNAMESAELTENRPEDMQIIKILTVGVQRLVFKNTAKTSK